LPAAAQVSLGGLADLTPQSTGCTLKLGYTSVSCQEVRLHNLSYRAFAKGMR